MKITFSKKGKSDITEVITALSIQKKDTYVHAVPNSENSRFKSPPTSKLGST